ADRRQAAGRPAGRRAGGTGPLPAADRLAAGAAPRLRLQRGAVRPPPGHHKDWRELRCHRGQRPGRRDRTADGRRHRQAKARRRPGPGGDAGTAVEHRRGDDDCRAATGGRGRSRHVRGPRRGGRHVPCARARGRRRRPAGPGRRRPTEGPEGGDPMPAPGTWADVNQRRLTAELGRVRAALAGKPAPPATEPPPADLPPPAIDRVAEAFRLTPFERDVLLLCAGAEMDAGFAPLLEAHGGGPTLGLALATLANSRWSPLSPASPLRYWRLIDVQSGPALTTSPLRIDERILHFLAGAPGLDDRLLGLVRRLDLPRSLPPSHLAAARRLADGWWSTGEWTTFQLGGVDPDSTLDVAAQGCAELGLRLYAVRAADLPLAAVERAQLARLWERETCLGDVALLLDADGLDAAELARAAVPFAERLLAPLLIAARDPVPLPRRRAARLDVPPPTAAEQG